MNMILQAERGLIPDTLLRAGIRRLLRQRLRDEGADDLELAAERHNKLLATLSQGPIALATDAANAQHYEVPAAFFAASLGANMKYSSCYYPTGRETLDQAEAAMLDLSCKRAGLEDGMEVLDLGCGWGSMSLWIARHYPNCRITAVSNSASQREHIMARAAVLGTDKLNVITSDINVLQLDQQFDRIISVEMFEHMHNYQALLQNVASWLKPDGQLFVHIFTHRHLAYLFDVEGEDNWMGRYFFTGGIMPSDRLLLHFQDHLAIDRLWVVDGTHYERTANHWLANLDAQRESILATFTRTYGEAEAKLWLQRWRMFYMSCAELWGYRGGSEWHVCHYRFRRR